MRALLVRHVTLRSAGTTVLAIIAATCSCKKALDKEKKKRMLTDVWTAAVSPFLQLATCLLFSTFLFFVRTLLIGILDIISTLFTSDSLIGEIKADPCLLSYKN